ncbi:hypothetical protein LR48_Vigan04g117400 [Vigna angularis]|uniref:Uncharacterized protein n=1 Tax=Phaseolus angularis TaxID=3914 RepID=A0A0L9UE58_PHAAN|nr:hypothetical protein LR48_Vigan04g117400 [Vigna angularis]
MPLKRETVYPSVRLALSGANGAKRFSFTPVGLVDVVPACDVDGAPPAVQVALVDVLPPCDVDADPPIVELALLDVLSACVVVADPAPLVVPLMFCQWSKVITILIV